MNFDQRSLNEFQSEDVMINYCTESTPICISYGSPISFLSLDFSYEPLDEEQLQKELSNKFNEINFTDKDSLANNLIQLNTSEQGSNDNELNQKFYPSLEYLSSNNLNKEDISNSDNDGFDEQDDEQYYLNTCINLGKSAYRNKERFSDYLLEDNQVVNKEETYFYENDSTYKDKNNILSPRDLYSTSKSIAKVKKTNYETDTIPTSISNFSKKFLPRSMYKIDGKESDCSNSIENGPINSKPLLHSTDNLVTYKNENKTKGFKKLMGLFKKTT